MKADIYGYMFLRINEGELDRGAQRFLGREKVNDKEPMYF
jgi:hypothetical protein